jgi:predicted dehydrogenase
MLHYLVGDIERLSAQTANFHELDGIEDVATASLRFTNGATGVLNSVWHDNLARPSLRRVEVFCERRHIVIEGDDWFGPVSWTDADGTTGSLEGEALSAAVDPMRDGTDNPDGEFVRAVQEGRAATPDLHTAVAAHRVVDAMYASAAADGAVMRP